MSHVTCGIKMQLVLGLGQSIPTQLMASVKFYLHGAYSYSTATMLS